MQMVNGINKHSISFFHYFYKFLWAKKYFHFTHVPMIECHSLKLYLLMLELLDLLDAM
jgi:hypothetical protein